jgi:RND superfamily putative drug exporter
MTTGASGAVAVFDAVPTTGPGDPATVRLLRHLRADVIPAVEHDTGLQVHLGGETASNIDFAALTSRRLPVFVAAVLTISFVLLALVFRSVVVPLKAVLLNMLSVGSAYGVIVAVFQWGWGAGILGTAAAPIAPWIPVMVFAIVFGLSMDYEVFLLSSIREAWDNGADPRAAVVRGLRSTSRLITAAAAIMVLVFGSFVTSNLASLKVLGLGLAVAIALDATVIRMILVPAIMTMLGPASWWLPRWLHRRLPAGASPIPTRSSGAPSRDTVGVER